MKKTLLIISLGMSILYGCKKDDDSPTTKPSSYLGKWTYTKYIIWNRIVETDPWHRDTTGTYPGEYLELKDDGKATECWWVGSQFDYQTVYYKIDGNKFIEPNFPDNSKITITDNTLTISSIEDSTFVGGKENIWWIYTK